MFTEGDFAAFPLHAELLPLDYRTRVTSNRIMSFTTTLAPLLIFFLADVWFYILSAVFGACSPLVAYYEMAIALPNYVII